MNEEVVRYVGSRQEDFAFHREMNQGKIAAPIPPKQNNTTPYKL